MLLTLMLFTNIYPIDATSKISAIMQTTIYSILGVIIYGITIYKSGVIKELFGDNLLKRFKR